MFDQYFDGWEIKPQFKKEYISLWSGWLGKDNYHLLDQVTEEEWSRFNCLIAAISQKFRMGIADCNSGVVIFPQDITKDLDNYRTSMNKDSSLFSKFLIPDLECVITEDWDYTYIIWHKNNGAVETLIPFISDAKLNHFSS